jgi:hypothetical protein
MSFDDYKKSATRLMKLENLFFKVKHLISIGSDSSRLDEIDEAYIEIVMACNQIDRLAPMDKMELKQ